MLTRFHLWFWNVLEVYNRWILVALIVLVPSCINFNQDLWAQVIAYLMVCLMVMYSLEVIHYTPCIPSLTSWIMLLWISRIEKCSALLIVLTHKAIQVVYSHYILTLSMECLWYVKFWNLSFKQEDQLIESMTKGEAMALRMNAFWYNEFVFRQQLPILWEKIGSPCLVLVGDTAHRLAGRQAGRLADEIWLDFKILKILYKFNYLDFYFVDIGAMLLSVRSAF